ncbi:MAG: hypothetical protein AAF389_15070 [Gemmatimonadota bacterium]
MARPVADGQIPRMSVLRRLSAVALLVAVYLPLPRLLSERAGPAGAATRDAAEAAWVLGLTGTIIILVFAWVVVRMSGPPADERRWADRLTLLLRPDSERLAVGLGVVAFALAAAIAWFIHGGAPTSVDEMVQLAHARALAAGTLGLPTLASGADVALQNGIVTDDGWVSIYPPFHTILLALAASWGGHWLVGPAMTGVATAAATSVGQRLLGELSGRILGLLLVVSPYWLLLGSTHLSHSTAAAGIALTAWAGERATRQEGWLWPCLTGASIGVAVSARPWVGLVSAAAILLVLWRRPGLGRRSVALALGGAPFAALLFGWNQRLFGDALTLGYSRAFGPAHGLGFHVDPWGNEYGAIEALAYSSADLMLFGIRALESPLPILAILAVAWFRRPLSNGTALFAAWAAAAVTANALYWHHGIHFGPRMLLESTPAWLGLVAAVVGTALTDDSNATEARLGRTVLALTLIGGLALSPLALLQHRSARPTPLPAPSAVSEGPTTIFVHGAWASRVSGRLVADGVRRDSIETLLRRHDLCVADHFARDRESPPPGLRFDPLPGSPPELRVVELSPGNVIRVDPSHSPDAACTRQARSDRFGVLELEVVAWRTSPADPRIRYVRDMGPALNASVLDARPGPAYVLVDSSPDGEPRLFAYDEGMELLWGGAAGR